MSKPWAMPPYNGWSAAERLATLPIRRMAIADGQLSAPTVCSICWHDETLDPSDANPVGLHDERYDRPLEAYAVCRRCHRALHNRFTIPEPWRAIITQHGIDGSKWFELLSMDPAAVNQPFNLTYPMGLPAP